MEILAPAGSISALKAAIKGGADAVYLGLGEHNARIKSNDFNTDNLSEWVGYAHLFGVKVYVTLNTAVKDEELTRVLSLAKCAAESGVDALIVSDLGLAAILSECSDIPLHLSTQAGVQNSWDVRALKGLRIKRVILARETPIDQIKEIKRLVDEVEIFVQGAMCVSFSGGCLLGSVVYGASGNRGVCNQGCRLTYTAYDENGKELKSGKLLSPYDLSLGEKVSELPSMGVDSIKIEGRLKRAQYVYSATKYYREILDGKDPSDALKELLVSFNRGFCDGYTLAKSKRVINPLTSSHLGIEVGSIERVIDRKGYKYALVRSNHLFEKGDGAKILRKGVEVGGSDVTSVRVVGELQEIPVSDGVSAHDTVCLTTDHNKVEEAERFINALPIDLTVCGGVSEKLRLMAESGDICVAVESRSEAEPSRSPDNAALLGKLKKVGGTDFTVRSFTDSLSAPVFLNPSELAELRRKALSLLREKIIAAATPNHHFTAPTLRKALLDKRREGLLIVETEDVATISSVKADAFVLDPAVADVCFLSEQVKLAGERDCYLRLPKILREKEISYYEDLIRSIPTLGIYAENLYAVALARSLKRRYIVGFGMNVFNEQTMTLFEDADHVAGSVECHTVGDLTFAAGKMRLMSFAHCPFSVVYGTKCASCDRSKTELRYRSGEHEYLILRRQGASCVFTMFEDRITRRALPDQRISGYYSVIGLNPKEKRVMMEYISEGRRE
ncbi:MAG: U32 family peptidase [Clostridia bacterium]|nr:U32 family peptidase [Clostridia bacterium]